MVGGEMKSGKRSKESVMEEKGTYAIVFFFIISLNIIAIKFN